MHSYQKYSFQKYTKFYLFFQSCEKKFRFFCFYSHNYIKFDVLGSADNNGQQISIEDIVGESPRKNGKHFWQCIKCNEKKLRFSNAFH